MTIIPRQFIVIRRKIRSVSVPSAFNTRTLLVVIFILIVVAITILTILEKFNLQNRWDSSYYCKCSHNNSSENLKDSIKSIKLAPLALALALNKNNDDDKKLNNKNQPKSLSSSSKFRPFDWQGQNSYSRCQLYEKNNNNNAKTIEKFNRKKNHNQKHINKEKYALLILIHTARSNFERRSLLRQTWGSVTNFNEWEIIKIFLIGEKNMTESSEVDKKLEQESNKYGDLVKKSYFVDSYKNLTFKHMMGYEWAARLCNGASFVLKTDDDIIIDIFKVIKWINSLNISQQSQNNFDQKKSQRKSLTKSFNDNNKNTTIKSNTFYCRVYAGEKPHRNPSSKWYITKNDYQPATFPKFCSGGAYLTSMNVVKMIHSALQEPDIKLIWVDDVFITGIVPDKVNTKIRKKSRNNLNNRNIRKRSSITNTAVTIYHVDRSEEYNYYHWNKLYGGMALIREWSQSSLKISPWTFTLVEHGPRFREDFHKVWTKICSVHQFELIKNEKS